MAHYLITGGRGYIGTHLCKHLVKQGHAVSILDTVNPRNHSVSFEQVNLIQGDATCLRTMKRLLQNVDGCFHLASSTVAKTRSGNLNSHNANVVSTLTLFEALNQLNLENNIPIVYLSSSSVYGDNASTLIGENSFLRPLSSFAADKLSCEHHARSFFLSSNISSIGFRIFNVYGPEKIFEKEQENVVARFIYQIINNCPITIFGEGEQMRDFIFINDVIEYLIRAINTNNNGAEIYNLCTGKGLSINNLAKSLMAIIGNEVPIIYSPRAVGDISQSIGDPTKANIYFQYTARTSVAEGLKITAAKIISELENNSFSNEYFKQIHCAH